MNDYQRIDLTAVTTHLAKLGATCVIETGDVCDYAEATLPDGRLVQVSPSLDRQYVQDGWFVVLDGDTTTYRSQPGGPAEQYGTDVAPVLVHLDRILNASVPTA